MRWSTRLRGIGLLILLACHLVSSYHSQDYQIWDWGDRERKRIENQPLEHHGWQEEGGKENKVFDNAVQHTLYRGQFDENVLHESVNLRRPSNDVSITRWPSKGYLYIDDLITAEPSILGPRHHSVNQHLDINNGKHNTDKDSDVKSTNTNNDDKDDEEERTSNINVLNVSSKDSPYALINKYFSEREDNYEEKQSAYKKAVESGEIVNNVKDVEPDDVWLSDGGLLVLKGGVSRFSARNGGASTSDIRKWLDKSWEPLDDYQAPYREPILPPPDFIPNDTGVGVPLPPEDEEYNNVYKRKPKNERALQDNEIKSLPPTAKKKSKALHSSYIFTKDDKNYLIKQLPPPPSIKFDPILDEEKYISEMENFRPERRHIPQHAPQPHGAQLNVPNELLLVKTKPLLVDHPPSQPNLVTILPPLSHNQPPALVSPSPLITPPTEHTSTEEPITTSTTTVASNTVSSLPPFSQSTPSSSTIGTSYSRPSPTQTSGYYISTSTPSSYSFAFQTSYKSKPLIVKNRARAVLPTISPPTEAEKEEIKREIKLHKSSIPPLEQITTPMYTTKRSPPLITTPFYNPIITTTISPLFKPAPQITTLKSAPITIAIRNNGGGGIGNHKPPQITTTTIKVTSPKQHENSNQEKNIDSLNVYKTLTPRIKNPAEAKYYKGQTVTSINSIYTAVRDKKSPSLPSKISPPYHHHIPSPPQTHEGSFSPTIVTPTPTILTLPPRDPESIFNKLSKEFTFGKKLFSNKTPQTTHHSLPPQTSSNEIFSNEISDNDVGERRRASVVSGGGNSYYLVNKGRGRNVRKLPHYHFTVGKFPSNPFIALKRKLAARSKKDKKRKRHFFRPWHSSKLAPDSVTVATNAISKLARPPTQTSIQQRQLPFRQRNLRHKSLGGKGDGKIYVTRRPRYLSSVRRSGHGYASFFCGGKGCKSWGYTFRA